MDITQYVLKCFLASSSESATTLGRMNDYPSLSHSAWVGPSSM